MKFRISSHSRLSITCSLFVGILLAAIDTGAQSWQPPFANTYYGFNAGSITADRPPVAARAADLDGDGDQDVVIAQGNASSGFGVMLNNGSGFYTQGNHYYTGLAAADIVVSDFTGDGKPDVAISNNGQYNTGTTISLFPGNGNGTFGAKTDYTVGTAPAGLAVADFNGDSKPDLAVAIHGGGTGNTVRVLLNNGAGGFTGTPWTIGTATGPFKLQAGLLNNDALPDLVVADEQQHLSVLINTGSGFQVTDYAMQATIWAGDGLPNVVIADVDNDNDRDVLFSSSQTWDGTYGHILLRRNNGNGVLGNIETIQLEYNSIGAPSMEAADLNNDGFLDIVAASPSGRTGDGYRVLLNNGNGTFGAPVVRPGGQYTFVVLAADADGDGDKDVLTVDNYSVELTVHPNNGSGQFPVPVLQSAGLAGVATKLDAADADGDGDLDLLVSADSRTAVNAPVKLLLNNGNGTFAGAVTITPIYMGGTGAKFRDVNGDGKPDILFASGIQTTPYHFHTAINLGNGTFGPVQTWPMNACGWNDIDAADLDNDGDLDVVATEWLGCQNVPLSGQRIFISMNQGSGNFSAPVIKIVNPFPGPIAFCDFNEDGWMDLATGQSDGIDIHLNDSSGTFGSPVSFPMAQSPYDLLATDLNSDGHVDLVSCNYGSGPGDYSITVRLGTGNGSFGPVQLLPAAYSPDLANVSGLVAGDVDNDGDLDLIVGQGASNDLTVYKNAGNGVFSTFVRVGSYYGSASPWFADFDKDGHGDLAVLANLPPSGMQPALVILKGNNTGLRTGGAGLSACSGKVLPAAVAHTNAGPKSGLVVYPNPATRSVTLSLDLPEQGRCRVRLYNAMGQVVYSGREQTLSKGRQELQVSRGDLPAGIYRATVSYGATTLSRSVVFQ